MVKNERHEQCVNISSATVEFFSCSLKSKGFFFQNHSRELLKQALQRPSEIFTQKSQISAPWTWQNKSYETKLLQHAMHAKIDMEKVLSRVLLALKIHPAQIQQNTRQFPCSTSTFLVCLDHWERGCQAAWGQHETRKHLFSPPQYL